MIQISIKPTRNEAIALRFGKRIFFYSVLMVPLHEDQMHSLQIFLQRPFDSNVERFCLPDV